MGASSGSLLRVALSVLTKVDRCSRAGSVDLTGFRGAVSSSMPLELRLQAQNISEQKIAAEALAARFVPGVDGFSI